MKSIEQIQELKGLFKPRNNHVVLVLDEAMVKTEAGLHIPEVGVAQSVTGQVVEAAIKDKEDPDVELRPGDRVYFNAFAAQKLTIGDAKIIVVQSENIMGTINSAEIVKEDNS